MEISNFMIYIVAEAEAVLTHKGEYLTAIHCSGVGDRLEKMETKGN